MDSSLVVEVTFSMVHRWQDSSSRVSIGRQDLCKDQSETSYSPRLRLSPMMFMANKPRFGIGGCVMRLKLRSNVNPSIALPNHSTSHRGTAFSVNSSFSADT